MRLKNSQHCGWYLDERCIQVIDYNGSVGLEGKLGDISVSPETKTKFEVVPLS